MAPPEGGPGEGVAAGCRFCFGRSGIGQEGSVQVTTPTEAGRPIPITTLPNLRDLGGWPTAGGGRVRTGLLFRSADLDRLDGPGLAALGQLHLSTVIDLRTKAERDAAPDRLPAGAAPLVCDVLRDATQAAPAQLQKVLGDPRAAEQMLGGGRAEALLTQGYRQIVSLPSALDAYRRVFSTMAEDARRPLLFHCTTGKDRTGWAAAVILSLLGVSRDDVLRDYLLTNEQLLPALEPLMARFRSAGGDAALLEPVLGVRASYLEAAFDEVGQKFGSMEAYLATGLGLDEAAQVRLRSGLTADAGP